ncbi:hypothetical protein ACFXHA_29145 [Nocardia sp. NPDC059240]|uniref:hypothetical protein n=1 Tax=Nocardia sp. NPDC059240 TaxID=3346786 RepID=UPI0036B90008
MHYPLTVRLLLMAVAMLTALVIGMFAGGLAHLGSKRWTKALATGGTAFSAALTLALMVLENLGAFG